MSRKDALHDRAMISIASDGSQIEGSHKQWNALQRAHASGLALQASLGSDHVLRRNIRVALTGKTKYDDAFIKSTHGSHHISLVDHVAGLWNGLVGDKANPSLYKPRLKNIESSETFGVVQSNHSDTFDGLFTIKQEPDESDEALQMDNEAVNSVERDKLMNKFDLKPDLFNQPLRAEASKVSIYSLAFRQSQVICRGCLLQWFQFALNQRTPTWKAETLAMTHRRLGGPLEFNS